MKSLLTIAVISITGLFASSIYTKKLTTLDGTEIALHQYQGKKILLVNIASNSPYAATQLPQLQQLYQKYKDSLVVIAFPCNDFGSEPRSNEDIKSLLKHTYKISFPVSVRTGVKDSSTIHPVYKWLLTKAENGEMNSKVKKDFQKYLISKTGVIMGLFSGDTQPMDKVVTDAVEQ
jgi:glutathione peroxidase